MEHGVFLHKDMLACNDCVSDLLDVFAITVN